MKSKSDLHRLRVGDEIVGRTYDCDNVQLMLYNAALWNGHRIHYDHPYATEEEGYPGLVIAGPLIGDWLTQCLMEWLGENGTLLRLHYSNRRASYVGDALTTGGKITALDTGTGEVEIDLFVKNVREEVVAPGSATVRFLPTEP